MNDTKVVGIDLGTSNCAITYGSAENLEMVPIRQLYGAQREGEGMTLPSVLYVSPEEELSEISELPWQGKVRDTVVLGQFARDRGLAVPDRYVSSAKSWLCNSHINRREKVLPWKSESIKDKFSPVEASCRYLKYLREALRYYLVSNEQSLTDDVKYAVTIPASFDEIAKTLTLEAVEEAGFDNVTLLEEPQAAFYSWLSNYGEEWRDLVRPEDLILVCDVGGGTTDFSLIKVEDQDGELGLRRISVGRHILLGGDNMDLALAFFLRGKLESEGKSIDDWQMLSLIQNARVAKEKLIGSNAQKEFNISLPSRGANIFATSVTVTATREEVSNLILEGFFPLSEYNDLPVRGGSTGLQEFGLPYEEDPVVSKHLAEFLNQSAGAAGTNFIKPAAILFNGGAFKSDILRERLVAILSKWTGEAVRELPGADFDLAVARGAAFYSAVRSSGEGIRIKAGSPRSYYIGIESSMPAIPGYKPPVKGVCVVPQGMEEGTEAILEGREFGLIVGREVHFRFFSAVDKPEVTPGSLIDNAERDLEETDSLVASLPADEGESGEMLPVRIKSYMSETGSLELWMEHLNSERKWKLGFDIRGDR